MLLRALVLAAAIAAPAAAQDTVDNPVYASWAKFKPKTAVVLKSVATTSIMGNESKTETEITYTLTELTDEKAVIEMTSVTKVMGNEIKSPAIKLSHLKKVPKPAPAVPPEGQKAAPKPEEGTETVKVGGTEYKAKWMKVKSSANGNESESKTWTSDEIPGTMLKSETTITGTFSTKSVMEVIEVKKP